MEDKGTLWAARRPHKDEDADLAHSKMGWILVSPDLQVYPCRTDNPLSPCT